MSYIDATHANKQIYIWERDENGELHYFTYPAPYYFFAKNQTNGKYNGLFGEPLSVHTFNSFHKLKEKREELKNKGHTIYESDIPPTYKVLSDLYYKEDMSHPINIGFYDIEVDFQLSQGKGFPRPDNAFGIINSIAFFDVTNQQYYLFMLSNQKYEIEDWKEGLPIKCYHFRRETDLIREFEDCIQHIDILSGWNSESFDDLYVFERVKLLFGEEYALKFFSRDHFKTFVKDTYDDYGNETRVLNPKGRVLFDLMKLYKNFTQNELESYSLNSVSDYELEEEKIQYEGNLGDLYRNDPQKFFEYSFYDVYLLKKLHDKLQHINLAVMLSRESCVLFEDVFGSVRLIEQAIYNYSHYEKENMIILPDVQEVTKESLPGAFVYTTVNGVHNWVGTIDLGSLYPSIIRSLNISPETYVFQCKDRMDDFIKIVEQSNESLEIIDVYSKESIELTGKDAYELICEEGFTLSANGSLFTNNFRGIIPEVLDVWVHERDEFKNLMKQTSDSFEVDRYNTFQWIKKIIANSTFGILSNEYSRFFHIDLAKSITVTGQFIGSFQGRRVDELIEEIKR